MLPSIKRSLCIYFTKTMKKADIISHYVAQIWRMSVTSNEQRHLGNHLFNNVSFVI